jgi:ribose 5-phosphate isomerase A
MEFVDDGMILGLGTGRTTAHFIDMLAEQLERGALREVRCVPTSEATAARAKNLGIPLTSLQDHAEIDLAVDGADEVDPQMNLIKGLGRALTREKIVEIHAKQFIVVVEERKLVPRLGCLNPLPVELIPFEVGAHVRWLNTLGCQAELWLEEDGTPIVTDNGNNLARCWFAEGIQDVYGLSAELANRPGIVEHGLFLNMATHIVVAGTEGVKVMER